MKKEVFNKKMNINQQNSLRSKLLENIFEFLKKEG